MTDTKNIFLLGKCFALFPRSVLCISLYVSLCFPKVELSSTAQKDIISDLVEIDQLCDSLDVVNILLGFLATGGGRADTRLDDYLIKLRMKSKPISKMVSTLYSSCFIFNVTTFY